MQVLIQKTNRKDKKLEAVIDGKKTVPFGASGMSDYTIHKDSERKARCINRHKGMNEDWTKSGINTAGFYSKHILWNKTTLKGSVEDLNKRYKNINFILK